MSCFACGAEWDISKPIEADLCSQCTLQRNAFVAGFKRAALRFHFSHAPTEQELDKWLTSMPKHVAAWGEQTLNEQAIECWREYVAQRSTIGRG